MREWCSCGAAIHSTPKRVREWRQTHRHETASEPEPQKNGASSQVESAYQIDDAEVRVGFTRNR